MTNQHPLFIKLFLGIFLTIFASILADSQGNANAEKQRIDTKIQDQKIEDQRFENQRQEQKIIDRQLEDRRLEQKSQDDAHQRRNRNDVAIRDRHASSADEDRTQNALNQMMDVNRFRYPQSSQYNNERSGAEATSEFTDKGSGCAGGSCSYPGNGSNEGCAPLNCCDKKFVHSMEAQERGREQEHQHRVHVVEQWDRDHSRD
jgi:hypothetical protein